MEHKEVIWTCKIGAKMNGELRPGADYPMRQAIEQMFQIMTGEQSEFLFSGWGGVLTEPERAVIENRLPRED